MKFCNSVFSLNTRRRQNGIEWLGATYRASWDGAHFSKQYFRYINTKSIKQWPSVQFRLSFADVMVCCETVSAQLQAEGSIALDPFFGLVFSSVRTSYTCTHNSTNYMRLGRWWAFCWPAIGPIQSCDNKDMQEERLEIDGTTFLHRDINKNIVETLQIWGLI